ncbi:hypothetical protein HOK021_45880 [Streptomyces hygroscopicus]|nr:hypothetical protein HOK021_45880 [Streptomyces hygroscopicus]
MRRTEVRPHLSSGSAMLSGREEDGPGFGGSGLRAAFGAGVRAFV